MALTGKPIQVQQQKPMPPARDLSAVVPKATFSALPPNAQKAAQEAYSKGGSSYLQQNVTGQPWENDIKQALAAGAGAAQNGQTGMRPAMTDGIGVRQGQVTNPAPPPGGGPGQPGAPPQGPAATGWQGVGNVLNRMDPAVKAQLMAEMQNIPAGGGSRYQFMLSKLKEMGAPGANLLPDQGNGAFDWYAWQRATGRPPTTQDPTGGGGGGLGLPGMPQTDPPQPGPTSGPIYSGDTYPGGATQTPPIIDPSSLPKVGSAGGGTVDPAILKNIIGGNPGGGFISPF